MIVNSDALWNQRSELRGDHDRVQLLKHCCKENTVNQAFYRRLRDFGRTRMLKTLLQTLLALVASMRRTFNLLLFLRRVVEEVVTCREMIGLAFVPRDGTKDAQKRRWSRYLKPASASKLGMMVKKCSQPLARDTAAKQRKDTCCKCDDQ